LRGKTVAIKTDNQVALSYVKRGTGRIKALRYWARRIALLAYDHGIILSPSYIPGHLNDLADKQSRLFEAVFRKEISQALDIPLPAAFPWPKMTPILKESELMKRHQGALVTPYWPGAPWWPILLATASQALQVPAQLTQLERGVSRAPLQRLIVWSFSSRPRLALTGIIGQWFLLSR
jgi:hypothetical protein